MKFSSKSKIVVRNPNFFFGVLAEVNKTAMMMMMMMMMTMTMRITYSRAYPWKFLSDDARFDGFIGRVVEVFRRLYVQSRVSHNPASFLDVRAF